MTLSSSSPDPTPAGPAQDATEGEDLVGETIGGRYRITRVLGRGGMGVVLEALHEELGQAYAVKVLGRAFTQNATVVKRFLREARTVARIGHPHIVSVHDLGTLTDGRPYLVMELVQGRTLKDMVLEDGVMTPAYVAQLFAGVADALEVVHARGIVHRDIKLENIMLAQRPDGPPVVKLLDFGVASVSSGSSKEVRITQHGWLVGTPLYLPPEAGTGSAADARWDVYALGVVAYAMMTARWPFDGEGPMVVLTKKMTQKAPPLSDASTEFPEAVEKAVARALAMHPEDRYGSARSFVEALEKATRQDAVATADLPAAPTPPGYLAREVPQYAVDTLGATPRKTMLPARPWPYAAMAWAAAATIVAAIAWWIATPSRGGLAPLPIREILAGGPEPSGEEGAVALAEPDAPKEGEGVARAPGSPPAASPSASPAISPVDDPTLAALPPPVSPAPSASPPASPSASPASPAPSRAPAATAAPTPAAPPPTPRATRAPVAVVPPPTGPVPSSPGRDTGRAKALTQDGMTAMVEGRMVRAIELFRDATIADDRYVPAWRALGPVNDRMKQYGEATIAYRRYLALADGSEDAATIAHAQQRLRELSASSKL